VPPPRDHPGAGRGGGGGGVKAFTLVRVR